jgi:hypothetical protein
VEAPGSNPGIPTTTEPIYLGLRLRSGPVLPRCSLIAHIRPEPSPDHGAELSVDVSLCTPGLAVP